MNIFTNMDLLNTNLVALYISAIILFLGSPGPVTVMVANTSAKHGFKAGFATVAGTNLASLILIAISFAVLLGAFAVNETLLLWITLFGSLYLLNFAYHIFKEPIDLNADTGNQTLEIDKNSIVSSCFKQGFIIGISNPKDILFFIAFFPTFFNVANNHYLSMSILLGIWILLDYSILSAYSLIFSKINNYKIINTISKLSGAILLLVASYAIYRTSMALFLSFQS